MNISVQDFPFEDISFSLITDEFGGRWLLAKELNDHFKYWPAENCTLTALGLEHPMVAVACLPTCFKYAVFNGEQTADFNNFTTQLYSYLRAGV